MALTMETLDKVFLVVFARCRRGSGDANLVSAWSRAAYKVSGYILWPMAAAAVVFILIAYALMKTGSPSEHKSLVQVATVVAWLTATFLLNRRFRKYLSNPPALTSEESRAERQLVFRFRAVSIAVFVLTCLVGLILHRAGVQFMGGF